MPAGRIVVMVAVAILTALAVGVITALVVTRDGDQQVAHTQTTGETGPNDGPDEGRVARTEPSPTVTPVPDPVSSAPPPGPSPGVTIPTSTTPTSSGADIPVGATAEPSTAVVAMPAGCHEQGDAPPTGHVPHPPGYAATSFTDASHHVTLAIPQDFWNSHAYDGSVAEWTDGTVTLTYRVVVGAGVTGAIDHSEGLCRSGRSGGGRVTYSPPPNENTLRDGRYMVALDHGGDSYSYERGKVRCGDLASYRISWTGSQFHPMADAIANRLYDDDPALDAIGGVHASC